MATLKILNLIKSKATVLVVLTIFVQQGIAQDSIVDQEVKVNQQGWIDYNFSSRWRKDRILSTQIGYRTITPNVYDRIVAISVINFKNKRGFKLFKSKEPFINSFQMGAGVWYTNNYDSNNNLELRFVQGMKFNIPTVKDFLIYNYTRLEERLQNSFDDNGWRLGFRLRHRISINIQWEKHKLKFTEGLYFPISAEFFFNLKRAERFNDLIRLSPGIGYKIRSGWRFELYTIFNRTKNLTETNDKSSDFILRLRIYQAPHERDKRLAPANEFDPDEDEEQ